MASFSASNVAFSAVSCSLKRDQVSNLRKASLSFSRVPALRFRVACAAKRETVNEVVDAVRKQLALGDDIEVNGKSILSKLGADSDLDTFGKIVTSGDTM